MSDIDQDDLKREYLPLVNNNSMTGEQLINPKVNNESILSKHKDTDGKASNSNRVSERPTPESPDA